MAQEDFVLAIELGMPWSRTFSLTKRATTPDHVNGWLSGIKCAYLLKRSTTTNNESNLPDFGKPSIKSIDFGIVRPPIRSPILEGSRRTENQLESN